MKNQLDGKKMYCSFYSGDIEVALPMDIVQEVVNYPETIVPVPLSPEYCKGIFNLRGMIIPIIDLGNILQTGEDLAQRKIAITTYHDIRIGLVFDRTNEILKIDLEDESEVTYQEASSHAIIKGIIKLHEGSRLLQLLDPETLIKLEDIPHVVSKIRSTKLDAKKDHKSVTRKKGITFNIKGVKLLSKMEHIFEIINLQEFQKGFLNYPYSKGLVDLRGMMIPVMELGSFLEPGEGLTQTDDQRIVILGFENKLKLGLLVDSVDSILTYSEEEVLPMGSMVTQEHPIYSGILPQEGGENAFLLEHDFFMSHPEIKHFVEGHAKLVVDKSKDKSVKNSKKETFISFSMGESYCFPILDINEIIEMPSDITRPPGAPAHLRGVYNLRGTAVTLVNLKMMKDTAETNVASNKVIILKENDQTLGLIVDSVEDIFSIYVQDKFPCPEIMKSTMNQDLSGVIREFVLVNDGNTQKNKKLAVLDVKKFFDPKIYKAS